MVYTLQFDGACRGNPGLCGAGYVIYKEDEILEKHSKFVSEKNTNNYAEYSALLLGIERVVELGIKDINVQGDSQLAINQINGIYRINSENIIELYNKVIENLINFNSFTFRHIKREKNKVADHLANVAIKKYRDHINSNICKNFS
tara:strand:+ start:4456 stop:4893 length:438 start_codon:yes stop_codon:yes gene_type:complete